MSGLLTTKKPSTGRVGLIVVAACVAVLGAVILLPQKGQETYSPNNANEVIAQCEATVKDQLKAPATARFESTATGDETWTVTGTVDAENSFGANVRSDYQCTVTVNSSENIRTTVDYIR